MKLLWDLPHVFYPGSSPEENTRALAILLQCLVDLDDGYLMHNAAPPLYRSGVIYGRTEVWDTIKACLDKGFGDCKTLTAWRIAELRRAGIEAAPVFRWVARSSNPAVLDYHILVGLPDGSFEDPSRILGMTD